MPDSSAGDQHADGQDRTAKIEELLLAGLDYYFAGEHEQAITVWTRVLFLDRSHARARAYIERARGALAERQRESEALIVQGIAAFDQGEASTARTLLSSAVAQGGPHDVALALLDRLNRLDRGGLEVDAREAADERPARRTRSAPGPRRSRAWLAWLAVPVLALVGAAVYVAVALPDVPSASRARRGSGAPGAVRSTRDALPLPTSADVALSRARTLWTTGHLKQALAALESIRPGDPAHPDAERLRADIQESLLAGLPPLGGAR